jgi:hypothetical protein
MYTEQLTQALSIAANPIHPQSVGVGTADTGGIDLSKFRRALFVLNVGAFGGSATVDFKLQESADGISYSDLSGFAITQLAAAGGNNRLASIEVRAGQLSAGKRYVRGRVTVGTAATLLHVLPLGGEAVQKPASAHNITAVAQQVAPA